MAYLNSAAEGIPPLAIGDALNEYYRDKQRAWKDETRTGNAGKKPVLTAGFFGLSAEEIGICSSSSEAYNLAALPLRLKEGDEVVVNDLDFPSGATPWLQPSCPATSRVWRNRAGALRVDDLVPLLNTRTRLVTVSLVSFFNGFRIHLPEVVATVRKYSNALLAVDATQRLGVFMNLAGAGPDRKQHAQVDSRLSRWRSGRRAHDRRRGVDGPGRRLVQPR